MPLRAARWLRLAHVGRAVRAWPWLLLLAVLVGARLSRGAGIADAFALLSRPFWPGPAQSEWLRSAQQLGDQVRIQQLQNDNARLRSLLQLRRSSSSAITAAVIGRDTAGWWQQLLLGSGSLQGVRPGQAVLAPGGLVGRVVSVTPTTATVRLLTDPASRVGVLVPARQRHGLLAGVGTSRPVLRFLDKDPGVRPGDVVVTSPASTLVAPNLPVGVIQSVQERADPAPEAAVQLIAPLEAVDWVQVLTP
ncbi:MAG: rod shape-determining protein MreC [Cyanobacteriota bacterium]|jgi:rod shape-determining protein MreC|nr:rod shape-determining protein MreC [Cyanobacteriota bacterium]